MPGGYMKILLPIPSATLKKIVQQSRHRVKGCIIVTGLKDHMNWIISFWLAMSVRIYVYVWKTIELEYLATRDSLPYLILFDDKRKIVRITSIGRTDATIYHIRNCFVS